MLIFNKNKDCVTVRLTAIIVLLTAAIVQAGPLDDAVVHWKIDTVGANPFVNSGTAGSIADLTVTPTTSQGAYVTDGLGALVSNYDGLGNDGVGAYLGTGAGSINTAGAADGLDFSSDFTLWFRHAKYGTTGFLISKLSPGETQGWAIQGENTGYKFYMMDSAPGGFDSITISGLAVGTSDNPAGYDIAMIWDEDGTGAASSRNGTLTVYVYNSATAELAGTSSKTMTNRNQTYSYATYLGRTYTGAAQDTLGDIEQAAAWDRALSQSEVVQLTAVAGSCPDGSATMIGDLNEDCHVNLMDFAIIASEWAECTDPNEANCQ